MTLDCDCGGRFRRTDIVKIYSEKYKRDLYIDTDPVNCNWKCSKCGQTRTQKKRQANQKVKSELLSLHQ